MDEAGDLMRISFALTGGVAAGAVLRGVLPGCGACLYLPGLLALPTLGFLLFYLGRCGSFLPRARARALLAALFFFLGLFCSCTAFAGSFNGPVFPEGPLDRLCAAIARIPFPHRRTGALLRALLSGRRDLLDPATVSAFRRSGAAHILALSGLHLGILCLGLRAMLSVLGRSPAALCLRSILTIGTALFYALMTGASPSIVRATLFISLGEVLRLFPGRRRSNLRIYCSALLLQLCFSPGVIASLGFQLSYLAMLGIFSLFPVLEGWFPRGGGPMRRLWSAAALAISCQVFTAPLVWLRFHTFPRYFLITNLLALPLTEALMFCGIATLLLSCIPGGVCPGWLVSFTDGLCEALCRSLEIIAMD